MIVKTNNRKHLSNRGLIVLFFIACAVSLLSVNALSSRTSAVSSNTNEDLQKNIDERYKAIQVEEAEAAVDTHTLEIE